MPFHWKLLSTLLQPNAAHGATFFNMYSIISLITFAYAFYILGNTCPIVERDLAERGESIGTRQSTCPRFDYSKAVIGHLSVRVSHYLRSPSDLRHG